MAKLDLIEYPPERKPELGRRYTIAFKNRMHFILFDHETGVRYTIRSDNFKERDHMFRYSDEQWEVWLEYARGRWAPEVRGKPAPAWRPTVAYR